MRYIIFSPTNLWKHSVVSIITYCVEFFPFIRDGLKVLKLVKCSLALGFDVFYVLRFYVSRPQASAEWRTDSNAAYFPGE